MYPLPVQPPTRPGERFTMKNNAELKHKHNHNINISCWLSGFSRTMARMLIRLAPIPAAILLLSTAHAQSNMTHATGAPGAQPSPIVTVQAGKLGASITLGGTVVAYKQVTLTAQVPGRIELIAGTEGDSFDKDDVLVAVDDDDLLAQRRAALAQITNTQNQISNAQVQYSREIISPQGRRTYGSGGMGMPSMFDQMFTQPMSGMMPGNVGGTPWMDRQADLHTYGTRLNEAQTQYQAARSKLDEIDAKLRDTRSFAPFKGVIIGKHVEKGDTVHVGQPLIEYADLTYLQVQVEVPSRLMSGLHKGMLVPAKLDIGNTRTNVRVAQIFPTADAQRHTVTVKFDLPEGVAGGPGMYAEVMIPDVTTPVNTVPTVPDTAVSWRGSLPAVFVVGEDNQPRLRLIRLGDYVDSNYVSVLSGLQIGERIYVVPPTSSTSGWKGKSGQ